MPGKYANPGMKIKLQVKSQMLIMANKTLNIAVRINNKII